MFEKIKNFIQQCKRVFLVATKPDKFEFSQATKITGIGMILIGIIGFIIFIAVQLVGGL